MMDEWMVDGWIFISQNQRYSDGVLKEVATMFMYRYRCKRVH